MIWPEYLPLTVQPREDNNSMEKDGVLSYKGLQHSRSILLRTVFFMAAFLASGIWWIFRQGMCPIWKASSARPWMITWHFARKLGKHQLRPTKGRLLITF